MIFLLLGLLGIQTLEASLTMKDVDLMGPVALTVGNGHLYALDTGQCSVFYWDTETGQMLGQFGKKGNGPGEFMFTNKMGDIVYFKNMLIIIDESTQRIHYFDKNHSYIKTENTAFPGRFYFYPTRENLFVAKQSQGGKTQNVSLVNTLLSGSLELEKMPFDMYRRINETSWIYMPLADSFLISSNASNIFIGTKNDNRINVYSGVGVKVTSIRVPFDRQDISETQKEDLIKFLVPGAKLELGDMKGSCYDYILAFDKGLLVARYSKDSGMLTGFMINSPGFERRTPVSQNIGVDNSIYAFGNRLYTVGFDKSENYRITIHNWTD